MLPNLGGRSLAQPQGLFHAPICLDEARLRTMKILVSLSVAEKINDGLGGRIDADRNALNDVGMNSLLEHPRAKTDNFDTRAGDLWTPIPGPDTPPNGSWDTIGQLLKGQARIEEDHPIRHPLRRLCERL